MTDERRNEDRGLKVPAEFSCGDHGPFSARVEFKDSRRFNDGRGLSGSTAYVVVRCEGCCWKGRANHFKAVNPTEPNAFIKETVLAKVLLQAFNNLKFRIPGSCADALASLIMTS